MRWTVVLQTMFLAGSAQAASAITNVTQEIAKGLGAVPAGTLVVASPIASDVPATKADEISLRIASVLAGKLPNQARAHGQALGLSAAHAAAKGKPALVFLRLEIARGELRVTADAIPVVANSWDRIRLPPPPPIAHAFASASIDAEIRGALTPIPLEQAKLDRAKHDEGDVLAAACGDIDGDGSMELALVSQAKVSIGRLRQGKFVVTKSAQWSALSTRSAVTLREPLAAAAVVRGAGLIAATSDRMPVFLDADLKPKSPARGAPASADQCTAFDPPSSGFAGALFPCLGAGKEMLEAPAKKYDAVAYADVTDAEGKSSVTIAVREPGGRLTLKNAAGKRTIEGAGAQIALADLDLDGTPEIVTSSNATDEVLTIGALDGKARIKLPATTGIRAICTCPPEERGLPAVVAIVGDEVWLVR
jgi:hypothetical protein